MLAIAVLASAQADAADPGTYADGFEGPSIGTFWSMRNQNTTTSLQTAVVHGGAQAVKFTTTTYGQKEAQLEHVFSQKHFGRVSVWVRDPLEYIYFSLGLFNTQTGQSASIGVQDWDYDTYYSVGGKTTFPRSTGWHLFTIELGETTLRTLIDGQVVYTGSGGMRFDKVVLSMSGPGWTGTVYYDDFLFESWLMPEIGLDLPGGVPVASGGSWDAGVCLVGEPKTFPITIQNTGEGELSGLAASFEGTDPAEFSASFPQGTTVPSGGSVTCNLVAAPATGGSKSATLRITSNDADENPYLVQLSALSLSAADDSDSDGMNDAGEYKLSALGFDRLVPQSAMVAAYFDSATTNGLYSRSQVQALHVGTPLLARDPGTGMFTLTLGLEQSPDLLQFVPMPMSAADVSVKDDGRLEFRFNPPGNTAFFRLSSQ